MTVEGVKSERRFPSPECSSNIYKLNKTRNSIMGVREEQLQRLLGWHGAGMLSTQHIATI